MPDNIFLGRLLEWLLGTVSAGTVTEFFLWVLLVSFALLIWGSRRRKWLAWVAQGQAFLTTLGVLGTFVGIAVGLVTFDAENLDDSIPDLLAGLTTAFLTSVVGMALGLAFKNTPWFRPRSAAEEAGPDVGPEDIYETLRQQTELLEATRDAIAGSEESSLAGQLKLLRMDVADQQRVLEATRDAIAGNEESSLAGQLKLVRRDVADQYREGRRAQEEFTQELWTRLSDFGDLLARSATEQVIEALRQVIIEFNQKLTEQFGENFKALDASVKKLVEWQESYRLQLERLHALYEESVRSAAAVESSVTAIAESSASIPATMEQLRSLVETANHQLSELERHLAAFDELRERAVAAVPETKEAIKTIIDSLTVSVGQVTAHHDNLVKQTDEQQQRLGAHVAQVQEAMTAGLQEAQQRMAASHRVHAEEATRLLQQVVALGEKVQQDVKLATDRSDAHVRKLREAMSEGLEAMTKELAAAQSEHQKHAQESVKAFTDAGKRVVADLEATHHRVGDGMTEMHEQLAAATKELVAEQSRVSQQTVTAFRSQMEEAVRSTRSAVEQHQKDMDRVLSQEIERVMNAMGRALAQISGQFTRDYQELTERMAGIVNRVSRGRGSDR